MLLTSDDTRTLIDELFAEQQRLTAVERFARRHDGHDLPAQAKFYRALLPVTAPAPGQQYAFAVDLDACSGCKACVTACHSLNGLDENETWRGTGLLHGGTVDAPYQQTVTTACHHCVDPACLNGCPVLAYEKDPHTGIVRHLDDQCIGCQYCVLKCPYDVPKYSEQRGIVRKCDMCAGRLAVNEAPACVQACPSEAISIRIVDQREVADNCLRSAERLLPGAFESDYTKPTTAYVSTKRLPDNARPADADALRLEPAHWPLIWMLVLTQVAAGIFLSTWLIALDRPDLFAIGKTPLAGFGLAALIAGLAASVFHLGRPLGAWRAFLGIRRSWMSREIVAFALFGAAALGFALACFSGKDLGLIVPLGGGAAVAGVVAVFCSGMIYIDTRRPFWRLELVFPKFFGTALLLGAAGTACILGWPALSRPALLPAVHAAAWAATVVRTALFVWETQGLFRSLNDPESASHRSALVAWRLLQPLVFLRMALFVISSVFGLLAVFCGGPAAVSCATISFLSTFSSQLAERYFFFRAVVAPRMPGALRT